jgi:hypothetical protein
MKYSKCKQLGFNQEQTDKIKKVKISIQKWTKNYHLATIAKFESKCMIYYIYIILYILLYIILYIIYYIIMIY